MKRKRIGDRVNESEVFVNEYISVREAAERLNRSERTIRMWTQKGCMYGQFRYFKKDGKLLVSDYDVKRICKLTEQSKHDWIVRDGQQYTKVSVIVREWNIAQANIYRWIEKNPKGIALRTERVGDTIYVNEFDLRQVIGMKAKGYEQASNGGDWRTSEEMTEEEQELSKIYDRLREMQMNGESRTEEYMKLEARAKKLDSWRTKGTRARDIINVEEEKEQRSLAEARETKEWREREIEEINKRIEEKTKQGEDITSDEREYWKIVRDPQYQNALKTIDEIENKNVRRIYTSASTAELNKDVQR